MCMDYRLWTHRKSFNRYMVECEYDYISCSCLCEWCFNRYMVECELYPRTLAILRIKVLIDTWWNVNDKPRSIFRSWSFVLIDTWWNVNLFLSLLLIKISTVLIDTWWNVNDVAKNVILISFQVLIDTWWNVNITW